ncbi:glycoside hydrolase family protein [Gracilinema caldarium]|uniref:Glycoside hydrolase family 79 n=1 Tax=Gracilinema caldarium (strain ATCC 51460 / DSM 7334 / H1) TaxID=744872 RepID=F8EY84_GRAC1|nr:glycoside hydrolase family protein [Gracilinema caldarium]AEJ18243.1 Glycoside hydrolase family 79 [Gracilinema caldarium DSM 7334]
MKQKQPIIHIKLPRSIDKPVRFLHPHFLSYTIDISLILGGHWWGSSKKMHQGVASDRVQALDLLNPRLIDFTRQLGPAMIRIGGTEADRLFYKPGEKLIQKLYSPLLSDNIQRKQSHEYQLTKELWQTIHQFLDETGMELLFTISAGLADRDTDGKWIETNAQKLLAYTAKKGYKVAAWEFGNEINGFPFIYGWKHRVKPAQYIRDFARFGHLVKGLTPDSLIVGPASAVWPVIGEPYPITRALCKSPSVVFLDALSWHYYPQQSSRGRVATKRAKSYGLLNPRELNQILRWNTRMLNHIQRANTIRPLLQSTQNWVTETGHALYGGEPGLSDTFASALWWLDELGLLARHGVDRVFRQSLIGSNYGLLDETTLQLRPDYYASFLWERLMGNAVFVPRIISSTSSKLRLYVHRDEDMRTSLLLINIDRTHAARLEIDLTGYVPLHGVDQYLLQGQGGLLSPTVLLNGISLEEDFILRWGKKKTRKQYNIEQLSPSTEQATYQVPPLSVLFLVFQ